MFKFILTALIFLCSSTLSSAEFVQGLEVGSAAPDFQALAADGTLFTLSAAYPKGPVVLVFYRGGWCPHCNLQLQSYQENLKDFEALGVQVVALSVDTQDNAKKLAGEKSVTFQVLSDPSSSILKLYNVVYQVPFEVVSQYKNEYKIDLEAASGRKDHLIAQPATYVIDQNGKIIFLRVDEDYKDRTQPYEVLAFLTGTEIIK